MSEVDSLEVALFLIIALSYLLSTFTLIEKVKIFREVIDSLVYQYQTAILWICFQSHINVPID